MATKRGVSPNPQIDDAIAAMMKKVAAKDPADGLPPDIAVKVINTAITWEKAKHQIIDNETPFNPDDI